MSQYLYIILIDQNKNHLFKLMSRRIKILLLLNDNTANNLSNRKAINDKVHFYPISFFFVPRKTVIIWLLFP